MAARSQFEPLREAAWYQYCRIALRPTARIPNLHACMRSLMCAAGQGVRLDGAHGPECGRHTHWCPLAGCPPATTVHRPCGANQIVARSRRNNPNRCTRLSVNEKGEGRFRVAYCRSQPDGGDVAYASCMRRHAASYCHAAPQPPTGRAEFVKGPKDTLTYSTVTRMSRFPAASCARSYLMISFLC